MERVNKQILHLHDTIPFLLQKMFVWSSVEILKLVKIQFYLHIKTGTSTKGLLLGCPGKGCLAVCKRTLGNNANYDESFLICVDRLDSWLQTKV